MSRRKTMIAACAVYVLAVGPCHANDSSGRTEINKGLHPPAPDTRQDETQSLSDRELFYIIKNDIQFTGMPGRGGEDEENGKLVLFIRHLPEPTAVEIELMEDINGLETDGNGRPAPAPHEHSEEQGH